MFRINSKKRRIQLMELLLFLVLVAVFCLVILIML